jgi:hypothetical protein
MELKGLPEGSRPTRFHSPSPTLPSASVTEKTFEMLWIENGSSASPVKKTLPDSGNGNAKFARIDAPELRNVGGYRALADARTHVVSHSFDELLDLHASCSLGDRRGAPH